MGNTLQNSFSPSVFRHDPVELSYYEVESLITSLDDITDTLTHHLIGLENEAKVNKREFKRLTFT